MSATIKHKELGPKKTTTRNYANIPGTREPSLPVSNGWPCSVFWSFLANVYQDNTCASGIRLVPLELHCLCASLRRGLAHSGLYMSLLAWLIEAKLPWRGYWVQRLSVVSNVRFVVCCIAGCLIWSCVLMAEFSENADKHVPGFVNGRGSKIAWDLEATGYWQRQVVLLRTLVFMGALNYSLLAQKYLSCTTRSLTTGLRWLVQLPRAHGIDNRKQRNASSCRDSLLVFSF